MKLKIISLIVGLALLAVTSGCGDGVSFGNKSDIEAAKEAANLYLEGLRDSDYDKLKKTVTYSVYDSWPKNMNKFKEMLEERQKTTGKFKSWTLEDNPYYDEVNKQALIKATVTTDKYKAILELDLRNKTGKWLVHGVQSQKVITLNPTETKTK